MAVRRLIERGACIGEPLSLAVRILDIFDGAEFGQQESLIGVFESESAKPFDEVGEVNPWRGDFVAALVPVVGISGDDIDPFVAWIPRVGSPTIVVEDLEGEAGRHPRATECFDSLIVQDRHEGTPGIDKFRCVSVGDVAKSLGFVVEREPDLILVWLD